VDLPRQPAVEGFPTDRRERPARVGERGELRGRSTRVFELADGSLEWVAYSEPVAYAGPDGAWLLIDTTVRDDAARPGWLVSGANSWRAEFGPSLAEGVVLVGPDGERVVQRPVAAFGGRAANLSAARRVTGSNAVEYRDVWPGTDLRYTVLPTGLKEDIVVRERPAPGVASVDAEFVVTGVELEPVLVDTAAAHESASAADVGGRSLDLPEAAVSPAPELTVRANDPVGVRVGVRPRLSAGVQARVRPRGAEEGDLSVGVVEVFTASGRTAEAAAPLIEAGVVDEATSRVRMSVDAGWLAGLDDREFPVVIDPTWAFGVTDYVTYLGSSNANASAWGPSSGYGVRTGNPVIASNPSARWRSVLNMGWGGTPGTFAPHGLSALFSGAPAGVDPQQVTYAEVGIWRLAGASTTTAVTVTHANSVSWAGARSTAGSTWGTVSVPGNGNTGTLNVTEQVRALQSSANHGALLGIWGPESSEYSYKQVGVAVTIVTTNRPSPVAPADGVTHFARTLADTPTLSASAPDQANLRFRFEVSASADFSTLAADSGWLAKGVTTYKVHPANLRDGTVYFWRVSTYNDSWSLYSAVQMGVVRSWRMQRRLGVGQPSGYDEFGPVQVNLWNGNVVYSWSSPSVTTLGGDAGLSLTYNSMASTEDLVAGFPLGWTGDFDYLGPVSLVHTSGSVVVKMADGSAQTFTQQGNQWRADPLEFERLIRRPNNAGWTYEDDDGTVAEFNNQGGLVSTTSAEDHRKPASHTTTWSTLPAGAGGGQRVISRTDPVTGRSTTFSYGGESVCPTSSTQPAGLLCRATLMDGRSVHLEYTTGTAPQVNRIIVRPAGASGPSADDLVWDFGYDAAGRLVRIRDAEAADQIAAGVAPNDDTTRTVITYSTPAADPNEGRAASVTLPVAAAGTPAMRHSYTYSASMTDVIEEGRVNASGWTRRVHLDTLGRAFQDQDIAGRSTFTRYDPAFPTADRVSWTDTETRDNANNVVFMRTSTQYDAQDRPIRTWGPAPRSEFAATAWNNGTVTGAASTPRSETVYDEGLTGLQLKAWPTTGFAGAPTVFGPEIFTSTATVDWGTGAPAGLGVSDGWSLRLTGLLRLDEAGAHPIEAVANGKVRVVIDGVTRLDSWSSVDPNSNATVSGGTIPAGTAGRVVPIVVDFQDDVGAAALTLRWKQPSQTATQVIPAGALLPNYSLTTTERSMVAGTGAAPVWSTTQTTYSHPFLGLVASTVQDPGGLALTSTSSFEAPGAADGYLRRTAKTLPSGAGSQVTYQHYGSTETRDNPCTPADDPAPQGGLERGSTSAAAADGSRVVSESVYDASGRVVASRSGSVSSGGSTTWEGWTCSTFDARGRVTQVSYPAVSGVPARTVTTTYAVGGNPLVTARSDAAGTVTVTTDRAGNVVSYSDVWGIVTTSTHDRFGRVLNSSNPGGTLSYAYDLVGAVTEVRLNGQVLAQPVYDGAGRLSSVSYPAAGAGNGTSGVFSIDGYGRPSGVSWTGPGGSLFSQQVSRRVDGNIVDETVDGVDVHAGDNFVYDAIGRLVDARVRGTAGTHRFAYGFADAAASCSGVSGASLTAGRASNRSSRTETAPGGAVVSVWYCYDTADRVISSTDSQLAGTWGYDTRGNTVALAGETRSYDAANRHRRSAKGAVWVEYTRDVTDRIVQRTTSDPADPVLRYSYSASGDTADLTLDGSNQVIEASIALPGGVLYTHKPATPGQSVWSYPNLAGSVVAVADHTGAKQGATRWWDPDGNPLGATVVPDNAAGAFDHGWLGGHQRPLEHLAGLVATVQMGARQYLPGLGRFLQVDPVEGGGANDYAYPHDPINMTDLDGRFWTCNWCRKAWNKTTRAARSAGSWAKRNRGAIATVGAFAVCLSPLGPLACGAAQAAAWGVRSQQRIQRHGFRRSMGANVADGVLTAATFGLLRVPGHYALGRAGRESLSKSQRFFVSGMTRGSVGGSNFVGCQLGRRRGRGSYC
jgi:RHS repeat-associated protein